MAKALTVVKSTEPRETSMERRVREAMAHPGWQRGIIRARQQFHDDDRRSALRSAALGYDHEALALHAQADQHLAALDEACKAIGRAS